MKTILMTALICLTVFAVGYGQQKSAAKTTKTEVIAMKITSNAFKEGEIIPLKYGCDGPDISPALAWTGVPDSTKSLALIMDDPDAPAGTWVHWVIFNIPPDTTGLPENFPTTKEFPSGIRQGINDFHRYGYGGPCPPGEIHRYFFKLYALDTMLDLPPGASKAQLLTAMNGHILATAQLMGRYQRD